MAVTALSEQSLATLAVYRATLRRRLVVLGLLLLALLAAVSADLALGPSNLAIGDAVRTLFVTEGVDAATVVIVWDLRLPAALMAVLVGAALSVAGAEMQTTLNNPLASPFTLGMSSAAIFGAALAIVLDVGVVDVPRDWLISLNAFIFAFASVLLLQAVAMGRSMGVETLVLFGIALFFTFNALVAILQFVASEQALQQLVFWTMGSLGRADWPKVSLLATVVAVVTPFSLMAAWPLTALRLGEERARSLGIRVERLRFWSFLRVSLLTGASVAFVGTIAFIGLVGPHIARMLIGEDHRYFLPASALAGALLMSLASIGSKAIVPGAIIPIGLVTALIGVPFFVVLILGKRNSW
jgi:iron complex transport system permease protein